MHGGEISVPLPRTNDQLRDTLKVFSLTVCGIILNSIVIVKLCQGHSASYNVHLIERLGTHMRIWFELNRLTKNSVSFQKKAIHES